MSTSKILPFLDQYPSWVRLTSVAWIIFTASFAGILIIAPRTAMTEQVNTRIKDELAKEVTGDEVIDKVQRNLIALGDSREMIAESKIVETLAPLFSRPAFYGVREENWNYFLFTLCKTRLILEENIQYFKSTPRIRDDLGNVIQLMVKLQNEISTIYGPSFSVTDHIRRNIGSRDSFIKNLPPVITDPDYTFFDARDVTVRQIREILKPIGLANF